MKKILKEAKIPIGKFVTIKNREKINYNDIVGQLGLPLFIKPSNTGSSIGVAKVKSKNEFNKAIKKAFTYDNKVVIEKEIKGREVECAVVGNDNPVASLPGEIIPKQEFYTYEAKYNDNSGTKYEIPANLPKSIVKKIRKLAVQTFEALFCEGMGRVDFFLKDSGEIFVNEINTIPGPVMFRRLWEASGVPFSKLLDILINLALERFEREAKLKTTV